MDEKSIAKRIAGVGKEPGGTSCRTRDEDTSLAPEQTPMVPLGWTEWPEARRTAVADRVAGSGIVESLIGPYESLPVECDGMTRIVTYLLKQAGIRHKVMLGRISVEGKGEFEPHYWVELPSGEVVDYRSRMWFGNDRRIPQGVFRPEGTVVSYDGRSVSLPVSDTVFRILTGGEARRAWAREENRLRDQLRNLVGETVERVAARTKYLKVEPTKPGSKNHYKITYHDGQEKWVDAYPGRGLPNRREQRMLPRKLDKPSSQRAVNRLDKALETFKDSKDPKVLQHAVERNEVGLDREFAKTVNRLFVKTVKEKEGDGISDEAKKGLQVVTDHVNRNRKDAGLKEVVDKIFTRVRESELARRLVEKVKRYLQTGNPSDDLTPQETGLIYRQEDYGEVVPLSRRKNLDVEWTNHAEYRSDLRDVKPEKVNEAVKERLVEKLPHPDRKKMTIREPGAGTVVVNYDMTADPARADVVTVWASDERIRRVAARVCKRFSGAFAKASGSDVSTIVTI